MVPNVAGKELVYLVEQSRVAEPHVVEVVRRHHDVRSVLVAWCAMGVEGWLTIGVDGMIGNVYQSRLSHDQQLYICLVSPWHLPGDFSVCHSLDSSEYDEYVSRLTKRS